MFVYIDLEATQFSYEIISIGAVKENNDTFYSLVRPREPKKITKFITKLTGLTQDMFTEDVPMVCEVFTSFYKWATENTSEKVQFVCFGSFDGTLLDHCIKNYPKCNIFKKIRANLLNEDRVFNKIASSDNTQTFGINSLYNMYFEKNEVQDHNSLNDAIMLKELHSVLRETPIEVYKTSVEINYLEKYLRKFNKNRLRNCALKEYLNTLCPFELEILSFNDICEFSNIKGRAEAEIKYLYYNLTGKKLKGSIYEG